MEQVTASSCQARGGEAVGWGGGGLAEAGDGDRDQRRRRRVGEGGAWRSRSRSRGELRGGDAGLSGRQRRNEPGRRWAGAAADLAAERRRREPHGLGGGGDGAGRMPTVDSVEATQWSFRRWRQH